MEVTAYDYVSALSDHEPTDEEWTNCLSAEGYTSAKIRKILSNKCSREAKATCGVLKVLHA